ncbi:MAG: SMP-30/gluconolactonase/LRE family protein [Flavobacteriales bacterium]|nr:SMP-30/gluconolactonase/LRE family protein [Flavobacteriales bacterium]
MKFLLICFLVSQAGFSFSQILSSVESVEYDADNNRWLASNGNNVIVVDGNGDEVDYFGNDPESDYGMEIMNSILFTIAGNHVKGFDLSTGSEVMDQAISGAQFLNGLASDGGSRLWVTDFNADKIHELDVSDLANVVVTEVVSDTQSTPNGIVFDESGNRLVFVNWGSNAKIKSVDLGNAYEVMTLVTTSLGNCDGIDHDLNGNFYVSSWNPTRITKFYNEFTANEIITAPGLSAPADICYAEENDSLAIPNSNNNTITFVGFGINNVFETSETENGFSFFPNPVNEKTVIEFDIHSEGSVVLDILDASGKIVYSLINEKLSPGHHKVLMAGIDLAAGNYFFALKRNEVELVKPFLW